MANEFYTHGTFPSPNTKITSAAMRSELDLITAGFDKLPALTGNAGLLVAVNAGGTGMSVTNTAPNASKLATARGISASGDLSWSVSFDGTGDVTAAATLASTGVLAGTYPKVTVDAKGRVTGGSSLASADVTGALGYTPYNSTNPSGYITGINSSMVTTALGYTPYNSTNPSGYITGINSSMVTTALGYTPYNATNPNGYITSSASISGNAATATKVNSQGAYAASTPGTTRGPSGMNLLEVYNNGYPTTYGNVIHTYGTGAGQLLVGWSGSDGAHADNYVRSKRDNDAGAWSGWAKILTDQNYNSYAPTLTGGNASGSWAISVTGSAGSVAWGNVSGRPTALSSFTNDSGYITGSGNTTGYAKSLSGAPASTNGTDGWWRSSGQAGWYNSDYAVGIYATEATNVRTYGTGTNFIAAGNVTAYSDERVKKNWRDLPENFIESLSQVKHGIYDRTDAEITQVGVSAQSLQKLMPNAILTDSDGKLSVAYGNAALVAAIKLAERVVELEARLNAQEAKA